MPWALQRRVFILSIVGVVVALVVGVSWYFISYDAPSCTDGKQNQEEEGIDCGGSCSYLCTVGLIPPSVEFTRFVTPQSGRTDVIAYIENSNNSAAARGVSFSVELLNSANVVVATKEGIVDLPPGTVVPVFIPNFFSGSQDVARVFLDIDETSFQWFSYRESRTLPRISNTVIENTATPRITATLKNVTALALSNVTAIITVFNEKDNAIAASQTILSSIPAQGEAQAVFTWRAPFVSPPARVEVIPVLPL